MLVLDDVLLDALLHGRGGFRWPVAWVQLRAQLRRAVVHYLDEAVLHLQLGRQVEDGKVERDSDIANASCRAHAAGK